MLPGKDVYSVVAYFETLTRHLPRRLLIWKVTVNIVNMQLWAADNGWTFCLGRLCCKWKCKLSQRVVELVYKSEGCNPVEF